VALLVQVWGRPSSAGSAPFRGRTLVQAVELAAHWAWQQLVGGRVVARILAALSPAPPSRRSPGLRPMDSSASLATTIAGAGKAAVPPPSPAQTGASDNPSGSSAAAAASVVAATVSTGAGSVPAQAVAFPAEAVAMLARVAAAGAAVGSPHSAVSRATWVAPATSLRPAARAVASAWTAGVASLALGATGWEAAHGRERPAVRRVGSGVVAQETWALAPRLWLLVEQRRRTERGREGAAGAPATELQWRSAQTLLSEPRARTVDTRTVAAVLLLVDPCPLASEAGAVATGADVDALVAPGVGRGASPRPRPSALSLDFTDDEDDDRSASLSTSTWGVGPAGLGGAVGIGGRGPGLGVGSL